METKDQKESKWSFYDDRRSKERSLTFSFYCLRMTRVSGVSSLSVGKVRRSFVEMLAAGGKKVVSWRLAVRQALDGGDEIDKG